MFLRRHELPWITDRFPRARGDVPPRGCDPAHTAVFSPRTRGCSGMSYECTVTRTVFPAHAGMFLPGDGLYVGLKGFPRARGDVPIEWACASPIEQFSPRTRGCSCPPFRTVKPGQVFPAHAGMFLNARAMTVAQISFPRARGDVPPVKLITGGQGQFSPRTRGCSLQNGVQAASFQVFPAHAGMFLHRMPDHGCGAGFPRARGDVPIGGGDFLKLRKFSPRTRGCSSRVTRAKQSPPVFPAHAGMFLIHPHTHMSTRSFPRARGDVPINNHSLSFLSVFSPRTRGCSAFQAPLRHTPCVFPAHAGMFRSKEVVRIASKSFPRARGDVPLCRADTQGGRKFSPRTRGCSGKTYHHCL